MDQRKLSEMPFISRAMRLFIPCLLLFNVILFVCSHTIPVLGISIRTHAGTDTQWVPQVYSVGVQNIILDMWQAGCYPLAVMAALWSIVWPYAKLTGMFVCWYARPKLLARTWFRSRENILTIMDQVGKLSLFDTMVMCVISFTFNFGWSGIDADGKHAELQMSSIPQMGFHMSLYAVLLSLVCGEILLYIERKGSQDVRAFEVAASLASSRCASVVSSRLRARTGSSDFPEANRSRARSMSVDMYPEDAVRSNPDPSGRRVSVSDDRSADPTPSRRRMSSGVEAADLEPGEMVGTDYVPLHSVVGAPPTARYLVIFALVLCVVGMVSGLFIPSFHTVWGKFMGGIVALLGQDDVNHWSLVTLLVGAAPGPNEITWLEKFAMGIAMIILWAIIVVVPVAYMVALGVVWFVPMKAGWQYAGLTVCQVLGAWAAVDVCLLAIAVSAFGGASFGVEAFVNQIIHQGQMAVLSDLVEPMLHTTLCAFDLYVDVAVLLPICAALLMDVLGIYLYRSIKSAVAQNR